LTDDRSLDGAALLDRVETTLCRYVVLPTTHTITAVVLWIAATHAAPAWNIAPRLVIRGPEKRCGKSRLLDITEGLTYRPMVTANATASAIYRSIATAEGDPPTVLIDEADTIFGPAAGDNEDLRGLLNAGHQRNRPALRWDVNTRTVEELDTYAMAALAGIGRLPDTIEDRAIIIRMRRRAPHERVQPFRLGRDTPALKTLSIQLHTWARKHIATLGQATPNTPLEDRAADTWEPLLIIADTAGGHWPQRARTAATTLVEQAQTEDDDTLPTQLLADIRTAFADRTTIRTNELLATLKADPEAPWHTLGPGGLNARTLATMLKEFGIHSRVIRFDGNQQRGYTTTDFHDTWTRYLRPPPNPSQASHPSQPQLSPVENP
jgi:hypothetical protein